MIDPEAFAAEWIAAWNAHDLPRILGHYAPDIVLRSPRIATVMGGDAQAVSGLEALGAYWGRALQGAPDLHFSLDRVFVGAGALTLVYRNHRGQSAAETLVFGPDGRAQSSSVAYA